MKIENVINRKGEIVEYNATKIIDTVEKIFIATDHSNSQKEFKTDEVDWISNKIFYTLSKFDLKVIPIEIIQQTIEETLMNNGYFKQAKQFIIYKESRRLSRESKLGVNAILENVDDYISKQSWRVKENANSVYSFQGLTLAINGQVQSTYCLNLYPKEVRDAYLEGFIHIHDLSMGLTGYCAGWSLYDLICEGFNNGMMCSSGPPKHTDSLLSQIVNFLGTLQNEWAGAQAFSSFDTLVAPFVRNDKLTFKELKQNIQRLIFNLNTTSRWGGQTPFTNLTFDMSTDSIYSDMPVIIGGVPQNTCYKDYLNEIMMINEAFFEVLLEGDANGRIFTFPIPTVNITTNFQWESRAAKLLLEVTAKYGNPYFQNFLSSGLHPSDVRSFCCRLQLDKSEILAKTGGLFGSGELTGSVGVVTLNLPKLAYLAVDESDFFRLLGIYSDIAKTALESKRKFITDNFNKGMFPWTKRYLKRGYTTFFSTIGVIGGNEACLNLIKSDISKPESKTLMVKVLKYLREKVALYQKQTDNLYNLEAVPGEGVSYRLAKLDKKNHPNIITSGEEFPYYTNSTQLPVNATSNPIEALDHQEELQRLYNGGTVFHTYLAESNPDIMAIKEYIISTFAVYKIPYLSITPTFSICPNNKCSTNFIVGDVKICPECDQETEQYTRVVGYFRPVKSFNNGKYSEYLDRTNFEI